MTFCPLIDIYISDFQKAKVWCYQICYAEIWRKGELNMNYEDLRRKHQEEWEQQQEKWKRAQRWQVQFRSLGMFPEFFVQGPPEQRMTELSFDTSELETGRTEPPDDQIRIRDGFLVEGRVGEIDSSEKERLRSIGRIVAKSLRVAGYDSETDGFMFLAQQGELLDDLSVVYREVKEILSHNHDSSDDEQSQMQ